MKCPTRLPALLAAALLATGAAMAAGEPSKPAKPADTTAAKSSTSAAPGAAAKPAAKRMKPVDINSATAEELKKVPGIGDAEAEQIIRNRPYPTRAYLVTKGALGQEAYYAVKDHFVAAPPADPKAAKATKPAKTPKTP